MRLSAEPAFVLHTRPWRESSLLVEVLSAGSEVLRRPAIVPLPIFAEVVGEGGVHGVPFRSIEVHATAYAYPDNGGAAAEVFGGNVNCFAEGAHGL